MAGPGFEMLPMITIRVKVRAGLSDTLPHAVGEMAGRPLGGRFGLITVGCGCACASSQVVPLLAASSSRPPGVPSGGREERGFSHVTNRGLRRRAGGQQMASSPRPYPLNLLVLNGLDFFEDLNPRD
jgi:hypothetical protein